jgi:hypothetical protein
MGSGLVVLALAGGVVMAVRGWPLVGEALAGRRLEEALRRGRTGRLLALLGAPGRLAEARRSLEQLSTAELVALGDRMLGAVETDRGAAVLGAVADIVAARRGIEARWRRLRREGERAEEDGAVAVPPGAGA